VCEQSRAAIAGGGVNSGAGSHSIEYRAEIVFDLQAGKETYRKYLRLAPKNDPWRTYVEWEIGMNERANKRVAKYKTREAWLASFKRR
jgi:hypothetical protein